MEAVKATEQELFQAIRAVATEIRWHPTMVKVVRVTEVYDYHSLTVAL